MRIFLKKNGKNRAEKFGHQECGEAAEEVTKTSNKIDNPRNNGFCKKLREKCIFFEATRGV